MHNDVSQRIFCDLKNIVPQLNLVQDSTDEMEASYG